ncbi:MAG TPA: hypothetical protein VJB36_03950, partial [Methylomirabilota bacterium]|nr:hypothetical protein [Methylomirabilota bacterium]
MRATLGLVLTALPLLVATELPAAPPDAYSAAEIRGWVVDADTKQPLEGVHVVAQWILNTGLFFHGSHVTRLHILETVTDAQGEYHFPAWGPKPRPVLARLDWGTDPILTFFKPGYRVLSRNNYSPPPENEEEMAVRVSRWHGKTVALEPFRGTTDDWIRQLQLVQGRLGWGDRTEDIPPRLNDYWKHFPRTVLAVVEQ